MKNNTMKKITIIMLCVVMFATVLAVAVTANGAAQASETLPEVKKVKVIPVPWQEWRMGINEMGAIGVVDDIFFDPPEMPEDKVAIVRDYVVLDYEIPLDDLTWEGTAYLDWVQIDDPLDPYILPLNEHVEYFIETTETDRAVLVRYSVAWNSTPDVIEAHFINEAILESKSPQAIVGMLSNFDVHNDYDEPIDNFELELYGNIVPEDVLYVYDPPGPPTKVSCWLGDTWYGGWGAPPQINSIPGGIEIEWIDPDHPVQPCEWIHFGVALKPIKKVKFIPVPWQYWRITENLALEDLIIFDPPERQGTEVVIDREYAIIPYGEPAISLENLTWDGTSYLDWKPVPGDPVTLSPNDEVNFTFSIEETETAEAGLIRYTVAWADSPDVIESRFVNEAILEHSNTTIVGVLSNFDVHQDYPEPVDNFELELYGPWVPNNVTWWFPGWGAPPQINSIPGGIEILWIDTDNPVQTCQWVHFGIQIDPATGQEPTDAKAYWTQTLNLTGAKAYLTQLMTPGKVTGGGQIEAPVQTGGKKVDKASFGFNVMYQEGALKGELEYIDHATKMNVHAHDMTKLVVSNDKTKAWFEGTCTIDGVSGTFKAYVEDNGEPGKKDVFKITLSDGYTAGGQLLNGNIQIHKKP
jgi:hypothetical protein